MPPERGGTVIDERSLKLRDGRQLAYLDLGEGLPLIHFPGAPGSRLEGRLLASQLVGSGIRLVCPDVPGVGRSDPKPGRRLLDHVEDIVELADSLGWQRFAVEGLSAGAPYAAACAYRIPERLTACGLVCGQGPAPPGLPLKFRLAYAALRKALWLSKLWIPWLEHTTGSPEALEDYFEQLAQRLCPADRQCLREPAVRAALVASTLDAFRMGAQRVLDNTRLVFESVPWGFDLGEIRFAPIYLWHGEEDRIVPVQLARAVAAAIPGCRARFYPGEGHLSTVLGHAQEIYRELVSTGNPDFS